jgi:hypothetical protein
MIRCPVAHHQSSSDSRQYYGFKYSEYKSVDILHESIGIEHDSGDIGGQSNYVERKQRSSHHRGDCTNRFMGFDSRVVDYHPRDHRPNPMSRLGVRVSGPFRCNCYEMYVISLLIA